MSERILSRNGELNRSPDMPATNQMFDPAALKRVRLGGVTLAYISSEPPFHGSPEQYGYTEELSRRYADAQRSFGKDGNALPFRGFWDSRIAGLTLWDGDSPEYGFLLNRTLLERIRAAADVKGSALTQNELLLLGLGQGDDAVEAGFSPGAINAVNASYFASEVAFTKEAGLATMFAINRPLNYALGALVARQVGANDTLRIKELCSGSNNGHWRYGAQGALDAGARQVDVLLSDFVQPPINAEASERLSLSTEQYSLFDDMPALSDEERFNAMIARCGFDSVWQAEDQRISRIGDSWYQSLYRIKVADWNPRREELLEAMRQGKPLANASAHDYNGIIVERAMEKIDINSHPFGNYILGHGKDVTNFPGGLIKRVVNAFESQLTDDGVFVSSDVGDFGQGGKVHLYDSEISGIAARYKREDYALAKKVLEQEYGLEVNLLSFNDLADQYLPPHWRAQATEVEQELITNSPTHGVMVVRRKQRSPVPHTS